MKRLNLLTFIFICGYYGASAYPCNKYQFDLCNNRPTTAVNADIVIRWSFGTGPRSCKIEGEDITKKKFIILLKNFFDKILIQDTIDVNFYKIKKEVIQNEEFLFFKFEELGSPSNTSDLAIRLEKESFFPSLDRIDSLNNFLLNGYFQNALSILLDPDKESLLAETMKEYSILFPDYYPYNFDFSNCYVDKASISLVRNPYVKGFDYFFYSKLSKMEDKKPLSDFTILVNVGSDNKVTKFEVSDPNKREAVAGLLNLLRFENTNNRDAFLIIKIGTNRRQTRYNVANERALTNPASNGFEKTFPFRGAVH